MRLSISSSLALLVFIGIASASVVAASTDDTTMEARAKIANVLEERWWDKPHKTIVAQPPHTPKPIQNKPKHPTGSHCHSGSNCHSGKCNQGRCVSKPNEAKPGHYCNAGGQCEGGNYCSTGENFCKPKKTSGGSCVTGNSCQSGECNKSKCVDKRSISTGKSCSGDGQCVTGFCSYLENWRCRATFPSHHACSRDSVCSSGRCRWNKCT